MECYADDGRASGQFPLLDDECVLNLVTIVLPVEAKRSQLLDRPPETRVLLAILVCKSLVQKFILLQRVLPQPE